MAEFVYFCNAFVSHIETIGMKYIGRIIVFLGLLAMPMLALAQTDDPKKKSEIKLGKLDVIYEEEEYKGVVIDQREEKETESYMYQVPFLMDEEEDEEDVDVDETFPLNDEGAESEDEILWEGFDTAAIHLPKLDPSTITEPIIIELSKFSWPTPVTARPTSHFGPRRRRFHYGLDLAQPTGEPIYAAFDGVVRISKRNKSYGNLVIIHHANGLETYYAHMSKREVVVGQHVKSGELIGLCGNTGRSFGSHLHFEIRYMGNAMNPENVIDCSTHSLINKQLELTSSSFRKKGKGTTAGTGKASNGWYRVRQGDTLEKIARRNGTTVKRLCQLNGISQNKILHPGDRLKVSGSASSKTGQTSQSSPSSQTSQASTSSSIYTVRSGDTLSKIARNHGTTVKALCQLNGISENSTLRVGQKLKLK